MKVVTAGIVATCAFGLILSSCSAARLSGDDKKKGAGDDTKAGTAKTVLSDGGVGEPTDLGAAGPAPKINFGLLVNDLNCTFCHMEVHGTVVSLGDASPLRSDANGKVFGPWLVGGQYQADKALNSPPRLGGIVVAGGVKENYDNAGKEMPADAAGKPVFPVLDYTALATQTVGTVTSSATAFSLASASKVYAGNVVLVGTADKPIVIDNDVLIQGDLIIKGVYSGIGTLYVTGNIYIPANLKAAHPASFPYSDDAAAASAQGVADLKAGGMDALGLASAKSIFIGDLENYMDSANFPSAAADGAHGTRFNSIYDDISNATSKMYYASNGVWDVYKWFPELKFEQLYEEVTPCWTASTQRTLVSGHHWGERTWNRIDAYLYAGDVIGGVDRASNWTLNGGMIAQTMHIVSGADSDIAKANAQCGAARINFDYRLQNGLQILEKLGVHFPAKS